MIPARVMTTIRTGRRRWSPKARSETERAIATSSSWANGPFTSSTSLLGELATCLRFAPDVAHLGEQLLGSQPAEPGHGQGHARHYGHQHHDGQNDPHRVWNPRQRLSGVASRWMDPQANGSETRNSTVMAIQLEAAMIAPELSATWVS